MKTPTLVLFCLCSVAGEAASQTPEQQYFQWTTLPFPADEFVSRRVRLAQEMGSIGGRIFLAPSGHGVSGGETFRPRNDFLYFTGLELPDAIFVLDAESGLSTVFAPRRDPRFASLTRSNDFPGRPLADDPLMESRTGLTLSPVEEFETMLSGLSGRTGSQVYVNAGQLGDTPAQRSMMDPPSPEEMLIEAIRTKYNVEVENAYASVARVRMIKSDAELTVMRRAAGITVEAISLTAQAITSGVDERTLEGILEGHFKRQGAPRPAFSSIIKSGPNSLWPWRILASHYNRRNRTMRDGDLVIFDVGAEYNYYVSDVGRTFPVSGSFTPRQREILNMELAVSQAIIDAVRPGVTFRDLQDVALDAIPPEHRHYMQAGLFFGHHLGMDTGDPNLPDAVLQPGMVFTVEPWYYNHDEGISVFTEDEILVTPTGAEVLTRHLPRTPEALEQMVHGISHPDP